ncbi:hypothetical protein GGI15_002085 [Coemansia interrupta]|uniref:HMG box domain-containing protein n=1 Tax=Coemansia interrupta TaxID=1126814 RepID=A0A9W8HLJ8_9FUNG|nr:hypothetical protein GGI15_002085 [Coemansia interrupta]
MYNSHLNLGLHPAPQSPQLTQAELSLIRQVRNLQQQRMRHRPVAGRQEPLSMINFEGRNYLEVRHGFDPIMVPSRLLTAVRTFLAQNLPQYLRSVGLQMPSPPQSPPSSSSFYMNMGPSSEAFQSAPPSNLGLHLAESSPAMSPEFSMSMSPPSIPLPEPMSIPHFGNPSGPLSSPVSSFPHSALPSASGATFNIASTPSASSNMEANGVLAEPVAAEGSSQKKPKSRSPPSSGKVAKRSPSNKSRKLQKTGHHNTATTSKAGNDNGQSDCSNDEDADGDDNMDGANGNGNGCDNDDDEEEEELRKPANAFILYRRQKNIELRAEKPGVNVETASYIIGKYWKEETEEIKEKFHKMAAKARDEYFIKKKRILARQKLRKLDREELVQGQTAQTLHKQPQQQQGANFLGQLMISGARELSSFAPEALSSVPLSAVSHQEFSGMQIPQSRLMRSQTVNFGSNIMASSSLNESSLCGGMLTSGAHSNLTPTLSQMNTNLSFSMGSKENDLESLFAESGLADLGMTQDINEQVATSLEKLNASYNQGNSTDAGQQQTSSASSPTGSDSASAMDWSSGQVGDGAAGDTDISGIMGTWFSKN